MFNPKKTFDIHTWVEERLSAFMDDQLASDERAQLESHLHDCSRCQASLESLRWTVSLLKQAPAPILARSFTLPLTRQASRASGFSFTFLRASTAIATVLLCLVVGLDFFSQSRFSAAPAAPLAAQFAAPTRNVALAPAAATTAPTSAPAATQAPLQPLSQPVALPSPSRANAGAVELRPTSPQADNAQKSSATVSAPPPAPRAAITASLALASPTPTQPALTLAAPSATNTPVPEARVQPTSDTSTRADETSLVLVPGIRLIEFGLLALAVIFGILTVVVWRRK